MIITENNLLVGVTAKKGKGWKRKLREIKKYKIKIFALFLEEILMEERKFTKSYQKCQ